jgi:MFS family permease
VDSSSSYWWVLVVSILAGVGTSVTGPIIKAELQNVTLPQARGQAFALANTTDDFGRGLGPALLALLITKMGGRTPAFNLAVGGWILCGVLNLAIFFTVERDESKVQTRIAASITRSHLVDGIGWVDDDFRGHYTLSHGALAAPFQRTDSRRSATPIESNQ